MNMSDWQENYINSANKKALPVLSFPGIQLLGVTVRELVSDGQLQAKCMKAIADHYPTLASVSNMDLSVEAEAFGAKAEFSDADVPNIVGQLVADEADIIALPVPPVGAGRTGEYIKAIQGAVQLITDRPVLAGVIGPFSLAGRLLEMTEIMYLAADEPDAVHLLLDKASTFIANYVAELKKAGANGIVMAEPAAGLLSPEWNKEFSAPYVKRIVDQVQDDNFLVVYHNCGRVITLLDDILSTGARAFHFGNITDLSAVIDRIPSDRLVMGNIDPVSQFVGGTPESISLAVSQLLQQMQDYPNFVLSSGCDIPPQTSLTNIAAFFAANP